MRKGKNVVLLLAAAVLVAVCAALPGLVAAYLDGESLGQTHYETVPNIRLQIHGEEEASAMEKLAMMCRMDGGIEISESMAAGSREEAEARALAILQGYMDAGLVEAFDPVILEIRCMLATVAAAPSLNGIFWMVVVVSADEQDYAQFDLAIDDRSGSALAVSYTREQNRADQPREMLLESFAGVYFQSLGIPGHGSFATDDLKDQYTGEKSYAVRYRFGDAEYGELNVDLYVHKYGFYTEFPDLGVNG